MTPTKGPLEIGSFPAESEAAQGKGRPKPESAHLRADAVSLEIPIKVHGSLVSSAASGAAPQAQPFEEQTTTMIVFPQGGVLKMSTSVSAGQVMVLTNLKSRQDSICRVIKVRAYAKAQSYVEVEFTSPQPGYWGVYFPTDAPEVARVAAQQAAAAPEPPAREASVPSAPQAPAAAPAAPVEQKAPEVSWAPAAALLTPLAAKPQQPAVHAEAPQLAAVPQRPPARAKFPESSFVSIGAKEDVLVAASSTKTAHQNPYTESARRPSTADSDISDAIDALIATSAAAVSTQSMPHTTSSVQARVVPASDVDVPAAAHAHAPASHGTASAADAAPAVPKQMFGVLLDSAQPVDHQNSHGASSKMWIPIGIAVVVAIAAGGAYYHSRNSASAVSAVSEPAASAPPAQTTISQLPVQQSSNASDGAAQQIPDQDSAALQSSGAAPTSDAAPESNPRASESSAKLAGLEPFAPRRESSSSAADKRPAAPAQPQPNVGIPSTFGVLNTHPVIGRKRSLESAGAAPSVDASGSPSVAVAGGSLSAIAPPALNIPAPPKPVVATAPVRVGGKVQPPRLVSSILPVYPPIAQQAGVTGTVIIDTTIDKAGNVVKTKVISGPELLRRAALSALQQWKYEPSKLNGQPISIQMVVSIQFH